VWAEGIRESCRPLGRHIYNVGRAVTPNTASLVFISLMPGLQLTMPFCRRLIPLYNFMQKRPTPETSPDVTDMRETHGLAVLDALFLHKSFPHEPFFECTFSLSIIHLPSECLPASFSFSHEPFPSSSFSPRASL
jgi:hypothetical protein